MDGLVHLRLGGVRGIALFRQIRHADLGVVQLTGNIAIVEISCCRLAGNPDEVMTQFAYDITDGDYGQHIRRVQEL